MTTDYLTTIFNQQQPKFDGKKLYLDHVEYVGNAELLKKYEEKKKLLGFPEEKLLFHGTPLENLQNILDNGFKVGKSFLIYFSDLIEQSLYYQLKVNYTGNEKEFTVLGCKVLVGECPTMKRNEKVKGKYTYRISYKEDEQSAFEYCVSETDRVLPLCLIKILIQ